MSGDFFVESFLELILYLNDILMIFKNGVVMSQRKDEMAKGELIMSALEINIDDLSGDDEKLESQKTKEEKQLEKMMKAFVEPLVGLGKDSDDLSSSMDISPMLETGETSFDCISACNDFDALGKGDASDAASDLTSGVNLEEGAALALAI